MKTVEQYRAKIDKLRTKLEDLRNTPPDDASIEKALRTVLAGQRTELEDDLDQLAYSFARGTNNVEVLRHMHESTMRKFIRGMMARMFENELIERAKEEAHSIGPGLPPTERAEQEKATLREIYQAELGEVAACRTEGVEIREDIHPAAVLGAPLAAVEAAGLLHGCD